VEFPFSPKTKAVRWTLGILGAIFVGALGSGVWQSLLGPAIHFSTRWMLDLTSLGLTSYKGRVYQQIAADNQSVVAVETFGWVWLGMTLGLTFYVSYALKEHLDIRSRIDRLSSMLSDAPRKQEPQMTLDTVSQGLPSLKLRLRVAQWLLYAFVLVASFLVVSGLISLVKLNYVNSADTHYHYVMRMASPYLDAGEHTQIESDFAQISSREDYVKVLSSLESKCQAHGKVVVKFDPW
jgi:hypothetical protein